MEITWRAIEVADIPAWTRLMAAIEEVDRTGEHYDEADLTEELHDPATGPADRRAAWSGDEMVAYGGVRPRQVITGYQRIDAEGGVHPAWRGKGLGTRVVGWVFDRAAAIRKESAPDVEARVHLFAVLDNEQQVALFEDQGFEPVNWTAVMRVVLDPTSPSAPVDFGTGISLHQYELRWARPMREAHNDAFLDHWGFVPWDEQTWEQWVDGSKNFRPGASWVLVDDETPERVVGYVQSNEYEAFEVATGRREAYLAKIGVRREYRGRGLASSLLRHSLNSYRDQGYAESALDVDTNNPTGAFGLYERAGYEIETRTAVFERRVYPDGIVG